MQRVVLYTILSNKQPLCSWIHPDCRKIKAFSQKIVNKISSNSSVLIKKMQSQQYWIYYFSQDEFLFVLAAAGSQRELRMKNYLKVIADIFYQIYDERKFPTVLNYLMTEINRIEGCENNEDQLQRLTNNNFHIHKERFNLLIRQKSQWSRTYKLTIALVVCIIFLLLYYIVRKYN